jgi:hypothetical protein
MEFDEHSNFGFPVALSAPGQLDVMEKGIDSPPAPSLGLRMYAPGVAETNVDWAVMIFCLHCTQTLASRSAAAPPSSSTIH